MFNRKKKSTSMSVNIEVAAEPADPTAPFRDFIEDLAVVFPGIVIPPPEETYYFLGGWGRRDPLRQYDVQTVKRAADGIRAAKTKESEAAEQKRAAELLKEIRSATAPIRRSSGGES